jgi:hypothetical protein
MAANRPRELDAPPHPIHVGAGAERRPLARQDERAGRRVGVLLESGANRLQRRRQLGDQNVVEGVSYLRAGERDAGDGRRRLEAKASERRDRGRLAHRGTSHIR